MTTAHRSTPSGCTAGTVVVAILGARAGELNVLLPQALADEPDAVHRARILVRRLRCVLHCHRDLFAADAVRHLRDLLQEVGDALGEVRDLEVRIGLAELRSPGPATADRDRHTELLVRLPSRLHGVGDWQGELDRFVRSPSLRRRAGGPPRKLLRRAVLREARTVTLGLADHVNTADIDALHRLRRRTRRVRYAAEALTTPPAAVFGTRLSRLGAAAKHLQDLLGDHRDLVLLAEHLQPLDPEAAAGALAEAAEPLVAVPAAARQFARRVAAFG